ncbi:unnamed protein product [Sphagnum jensenii]|uniref:Glycosyl transferase family 1 domain-containing protein n=1 Tax=Sphagnum jensenii TaxID=128206 RepID=A0ABP0XMZ1_9BRYO
MRAADLTLVMSHALGKEMNAAGASTAEKIRIWQKGVDSESFHTRFKSQEMRNHLTNGVPDTPLIVHVGRLGAEKNLDFLKKVMGGIPHIRLAFVGDGPFRASGVPVVAARAGGIPDIVTQDGETGFLYTPGDLDDCLSKIMALLESSELQQKIGAAGTAHFWASMTLLLDKCFKGESQGRSHLFITYSCMGV